MDRTLPIRRHTRLPLLCSVTYQSAYFTAIGSLGDFSRAGAHIMGPMPVRVGMTLRVHISIPGKGEDLRIDEAIVRWVKNSDFGIESRNLSHREQYWLNNYHDQLLGTHTGTAWATAPGIKRFKRLN